MALPSAHLQGLITHQPPYVGQQQPDHQGGAVEDCSLRTPTTYLVLLDRIEK